MSLFGLHARCRRDFRVVVLEGLAHRRRSSARHSQDPNVSRFVVLSRSFVEFMFCVCDALFSASFRSTLPKFIKDLTATTPVPTTAAEAATTMMAAK